MQEPCRKFSLENGKKRMIFTIVYNYGTSTSFPAAGGGKEEPLRAKNRPIDADR